MAEYIERKATLKVLCRKCNNEFSDEPCELPDCFILEAVKSLPSIDAVPVVRCWECKHCDPENHHCDHHMGTAAPLRRNPDDFCSYGERKDGADNG